VLDEFDALIIVEPLACLLEHDLGEIKAHANNLGAITLEKRKQASVSRPEVEDAMSVARELFEQDTLSLSAAWESIRPVEIAQDTLGSSPLVGRHACIIDCSRVAIPRRR
jgi:hypothetical protein